MLHYTIESVCHQKVQGKEEDGRQNLDKKFSEDYIGDPWVSATDIWSNNLNPFTLQTIQRLRRAAVAFVVLVDTGRGVQCDGNAAWLNALLQPARELKSKSHQKCHTTCNPWMLVSRPGKIRVINSWTQRILTWWACRCSGSGQW